MRNMAGRLASVPLSPEWEAPLLHYGSITLTDVDVVRVWSLDPSAVGAAAWHLFPICMQRTTSDRPHLILEGEGYFFGFFLSLSSPLTEAVLGPGIVVPQCCLASLLMEMSHRARQDEAASDMAACSAGHPKVKTWASF
jgi:hypothetical protein